ncbi:MAG: hypothetical protein ABSH38_03260 [Verrucomicrobiota bacterium]|jgi:hypothetical protein
MSKRTIIHLKESPLRAKDVNPVRRCASVKPDARYPSHQVWSKTDDKHTAVRRISIAFLGIGYDCESASRSLYGNAFVGHTAIVGPIGGSRGKDHRVSIVRGIDRRLNIGERKARRLYDIRSRLAWDSQQQQQ